MRTEPDVPALVNPEDPTCTLRTRAGPCGQNSEYLPVTIGNCRIIRLLGEGGIGSVYEAEQDYPRRRVAVKILKGGLISPELVWRFEHEAQALGRLKHPGIAQVYEAGAAQTGFGRQPYFVMELIRGESLLQFARAHRLNTRQRLQLMVRICDAVQHAHQSGIIHRDLKPANILVEEGGQPKILDLGVARLSNSEPEATRWTDSGQLVGTLAYMSPEQVMADPLEIDTRSDVYALGVILFELLTGHLPYKISSLVHEAVQTIREEDPPRLSSISRSYRGDVETIVNKALEKDKTRRYASAADLAADIRHYLQDEPIAARPPSATYQLHKFVRRHKPLFAGAVAIFSVLITGIAGSSWEAMRARQAEKAALHERDMVTRAEKAISQERDRAVKAERAARSERNRALAAEAQAVRERNRSIAEKNRADKESGTAKAVNDFLQNDLLAQAGASIQARADRKPDPDLKVRTALDRAAQRINGKFVNEPLVEASIRGTIGITYRRLGLYSEAQPQFERALALRRRLLGAEHPDTLAALNDLAELIWHEGKYTVAAPLFMEVLGARERILGKEHPDTLITMNDLGALYQRQGKYAQAEPLFLSVLRLRRRVLGQEHPDTLSTMIELAQLYQREGNYAEAEPLITNLVEIFQRVLGDEHPDTLISVNNLATLYVKEGKYAQAEPVLTRVADEERHVLGEEHPETLIALNNVAYLYRLQGRYGQAEALLTKLLQVKRRVLGNEHPSTLAAMGSLGAVYLGEGKYAEAEELLTTLVEVLRRVQGPEHPDTLRALSSIGALYRDQGQFAQAEAVDRNVLEIRQRVLGNEHPDTLLSMSELADLYIAQGKNAQAELLYTDVLQVRRRVLGQQHPDTTAALACLGGLRLDQGRYAEAETLFRAALHNFETSPPPDIWRQYNYQSMLGASLAGQHRYREAEMLLVSGYEGMRSNETRIPVFSQWNVQEAAKRILDFYQDWGKSDKAAVWRDKLVSGIPARRPD